MRQVSILEKLILGESVTVAMHKLKELNSAELHKVLRTTRVLGVFAQGSVHLCGSNTGRLYTKDVVYISRLCIGRSARCLWSTPCEDSSTERMLDALLRSCSVLSAYSSDSRHGVYEFVVPYAFYDAPFVAVQPNGSPLRRMMYENVHGASPESFQTLCFLQHPDGMVELQGLTASGGLVEAFVDLSVPQWPQRYIAWRATQTLSAVGSDVALYDIRLVCMASERALVLATSDGVWVENRYSITRVQGTEGVCMTALLCDWSGDKPVYKALSADGRMFTLKRLFSPSPNIVECVEVQTEDVYGGSPKRLVSSTLQQLHPEATHWEVRMHNEQFSIRPVQQSGSVEVVQ